MLCYLILLDNEDDRNKFEKMYLLYRNRMQYVAFSILANEQEAENLVHDTFITLIEQIDKIEEVECHRTWNYIVTILKNKCFNYIKRQKRIDYLDEEEFSLEAPVEIENEIFEQEIAAILATEIRKLKYPYKEILYLYYYNDMNSTEIGALLGMSAENVRQTMRRAKLKLKKLLLERGGNIEKDSF